ncbi:hypothetical protein P171DRAFT_402201 [Karstenula rhodostoma CBS 690.94]|uniref:Uncharacterized protein n=1 Tax=Karstenula rhodostoma CBS 690.94 TaxID=1392251 RepID=A0A9P4PX81_9PLEO|nr:hypothetical protein P171DRAFT_402201 [Karstenula rhodostoma CBS 690.94]
MYFTKTSVVLSFGLMASQVAGHAAVIKAVGDAGGQGSAIGVDPNTPRDGTGRNPFQQDSTRFRGDAADACGETLGGGANDVEAGTAQVMQLNGATLPQVSAGGMVMMTLHQVNGDGAGPYTAMIDSTGTGTQWTPITVATNVDGNARGRNNDNAMTDLPLNVAIPAGQTCTGTVAGQSNVCMVRVQNSARAGPFGGCIPVQMAGAAPAAGAAAPAGAAPVAAAPAAAAPAAAAPAGAASGATAPAAAAAAAPAAADPAVAAPAVAAPAVGAPAAAAPAAAAPAAAVSGVVAPAVAPAAGAAGASTDATALTKRAPKKSQDGALVSDDAEEEETNPSGRRTTIGV